MALRTKWRPGDRFLVRHKDQSIIVVEKAAGLLTVKTPKGDGADLVRLLRRFLAPGQRRVPLFVAHRLDRPASGLLVLARTKPAQDKLVKQFSKHNVERRYFAAVRGLVPDDSGCFESYLRSDPKTLRMFSDDGTEGKRAITHWKVLERYKKADATLLEVQLETGLRNQIRVHFSEAGFPLLGERKYLDPEAPGAASTQGNQRIFLHAKTLGFVHPDTKKRMSFEATLPPDLKGWVHQLERGRALHKLSSKRRPRKRQRR